MASSSIEVVNNALLRVGDAPITALTDNNDRARLMNRLYTPSLTAALRSHNWNFATFRVALAELSDAPVFGYEHQYQLPQDPQCLFVRSTDLEENEPWVIETYKTASSQYRVFATDASTVSIVYVGLVTDVTQWDGLFAEAMEVELAYKACYGITRNATLVQALQGERQEAWRRARSRDGQEGRPLINVRSTSLTQVR